MRNELFYLYSLDRFISYRRGVWLVFIITMFYRNPRINSNSVDLNLTQLSGLKSFMV